jgi:hypothetical protein
MHRRAAPSARSGRALCRAAVEALNNLHRILVIAGVFLFAFALTAVAVGGSGHRTLILEFTHGAQMIPTPTNGWGLGK